ncbi:MAG: site-specific integrase [Proteobacteria bacterium]|nr:site-specific integrase [Cystobacterineae bacterium]MCL2258886.1 site-specific integrase [Cystobacterineae bacterium]MCL2314650.1 site-specific integrase [Pseudomonadota bacterium]
MALRWGDIDFERGFITLEGEHAKNRTTERIPISGPMRELLEEIERTESPYVFPGRGGGKRTDFRRVARRVKERAGLPQDFRPLHGLRHAFASLAASSGKIDIYTLQKLLTYKSAAMTQRYAHLSDEALRRAAGTTGDFFKKKAAKRSRTK